GGEACEPPAHHADFHVEIGRERRSLRHLCHGLGVPARRVGRPLGRVHLCSFPRGPAAPLSRSMLDSRLREIDPVAMRLPLLRHAKAEKGEPGMSDRDRPLNARGCKDAPRIGAYMAHHALRPDRAVVSDSRRTRETWDGVAGAFPAPPPATFEEAL